MKLKGWPRTIRSQLLTGFVLIEVVSLILFATLLLHTQSKDIHDRAPAAP